MMEHPLSDVAMTNTITTRSAYDSAQATARSAARLACARGDEIGYAIVATAYSIVPIAWAIHAGAISSARNKWER